MSQEVKPNTRELIHSHLQQIPEDKLASVLDFVIFLEQRSGDRELMESMLLAQPLLAEDWLNPEENKAWAIL